MNGKKLDELCIDIVNTLGFTIKHPCTMNGLKMLTKEQINAYEEMIPMNHRNLNIYLVSFILERNDKKEKQKYPWKLQNTLNTKEDLKKLFNELYEIRNSVKLVKQVDDSVFIDVYYKYEKYLPVSSDPIDSRFIP